MKMQILGYDIKSSSNLLQLEGETRGHCIIRFISHELLIMIMQANLGDKKLAPLTIEIPDLGVSLFVCLDSCTVAHHIHTTGSSRIFISGWDVDFIVYDVQKSNPIQPPKWENY